MDLETRLEKKGLDNPSFVADDGTTTGNDSKTKSKIIVSSTPEALPEREQWANPIEFLLSCIAMSVGLGNVWRFPFTAYENGGGAFLIPYIIVLMFIGKPLYYLELCLGQFSSYGPVKLWDVVPFFRGVGYGFALAAWLVVTYYASLMGLSIFYLFASFSAELPWATCRPNVTNCIDSNTNISTIDINNSISSSESYFENEVLFRHPNGLDDGIFAPEWRLTLCLLAAWLIIFFVLVKGVKSSGKAAYFTALFPYVVLFVLLGKGLSLPGAWNGVKYFITPQWEKLLDPKVWFNAVGQCFFSLSVGYGSIPMFASYNKFSHNIYRDATIISFVDTFTSLLAGVTIFSILGHLASLMEVDDVSQVIKGGGSALAFISYPDVLAQFEYVPQLFAVLFFLMLLTLGVGSASALTGCVITTISDQFPHVSKTIITSIVCSAGFLIGLVYVTPQGQYLLDLVDFYGGVFLVYILTFMEVIAINWIYGYRNFTRDIEFMLKRKSGPYWIFCWVFFIPISLLSIFLYMVITWQPLTSGSYVYGPIANGVGFLIVGASLSIVPICFIVLLTRKDKKTSIWQAIKDSFSPSEGWGPKNPILRREYKEFVRSGGNLRAPNNEFVLDGVAGAKSNPKDPTLSYFRNVS